MLPTHLMASTLLYLLVTPDFLPPEILVFLLAGALLPDLDVKLNHRKSLHFPFIYPAIAVLTYLTSFYSMSAVFLSASLHCLMEATGNDAGEYVEEEKGAVYNHLKGNWIPGLGWIKQDGGPRDLLLLLALSAITLSVSRTPEIVLITTISLTSGVAYYRIRDRVGKLFPDFLLTK